MALFSGMRRMAFVVALLSLAGCAINQPTVHIDYVDFVQLGGINYVAAWTPPTRPLQQSDLGSVYGKVKVKVEGSNDPNHRIVDGDAAFLAPGTGVYAVKGYRTSFRVAATNQGRLTLYEADTNPKARVGADLVDLADKVLYIGVNSASDWHTELAAIKDPASVQKLVALVEAGTVDQTTQPGDGLMYFIDFHMADGTEVLRAYWPNSSQLQRGIHVPEAFRLAISVAVG